MGLLRALLAMSKPVGSDSQNRKLNGERGLTKDEFSLGLLGNLDERRKRFSLGIFEIGPPLGSQGRVGSINTICEIAQSHWRIGQSLAVICSIHPHVSNHKRSGSVSPLPKDGGDVGCPEKITRFSRALLPIAQVLAQQQLQPYAEQRVETTPCDAHGTFC